MKLIGHLKTIIVHKIYVFYYCFQFGLIWRGLVHDLSKFSPVEFFESVRYYTGKDSPINICKAKKGYSMAWFHHRGRNKHHYEYWCDNFEKGFTCVPMPWKYATEMLCDYLAAGKAYNGSSFTIEDELEWWYNVKKPVCKMHEDTKNYIEAMLEFMAKPQHGSLRKWSKYLFNKNNYSNGSKRIY